MQEETKSISPVLAVVYLAIVAALCLVPSVGLLFGGAEVSSDSDAAPMPQIANDDGTPNLNVLSDSGAWFDDHFAFRNEWVTVAAKVEGLFGVSPNESVVYGANGWLYYGDSVDDYRGYDQLSDRALFNIAHSAKLVQTYALGHGIDFGFTISPNKNTLYGENMPYYYQVAVGERNLDRIKPFLESEGVNYVDLQELFAGQERVLYHEKDSHWNNIGAAMAADAIMKALGHEHRSFAYEAFTERDDFVGDLEKMLYPSTPTPESEAYYDNGPAYEYVTEGVESNFDPKIETASAAIGTTGSLVMYRDSFGNSLLPFMAEAYSTAYFSRGVPYQLAIDLDAHGADALVVERAQRFMRDMAANPPVMPAPLLLEGLAPTEGFAPIENATELVQGDYLIVTGLAPDNIAGGERIAIRLNGSLVYEAFGLTDSETGDEGFQLLIPRSIAGDGGNDFELALF